MDRLLILVVTCLLVFLSSTGSADLIQTVVLSAESGVSSSKGEGTVEFINELGGPVYCQAVSTTPTFFIKQLQKKEGVDWRSIPIRCSWPDCDIDFDGPGKMDNGQRVKIVMPLVRYDSSTKKVVPLEPGFYRWVGSYQERPDGSQSKDWTWAEVQSNQFEVKP
ncbi:MAG: hypothetical protein HQL22_09260 [Candidatus Omnitrophica bacterium]|nr:hypothetical protein [Candidatus Omnitrophota bacterium]